MNPMLASELFCLKIQKGDLDPTFVVLNDGVSRRPDLRDIMALQPSIPLNTLRTFILPAGVTTHAAQIPIYYEDALSSATSLEEQDLYERLNIQAMYPELIEIWRKNDITALLKHCMKTRRKILQDVEEWLINISIECAQTQSKKMSIPLAGMFRFFMSMRVPDLRIQLRDAERNLNFNHIMNDTLAKIIKENFEAGGSFMWLEPWMVFSRNGLLAMAYERGAKITLLHLTSPSPIQYLPLKEDRKLVRSCSEGTKHPQSSYVNAFFTEDKLTRSCSEGNKSPQSSCVEPIVRIGSHSTIRPLVL